MPAWQKAGVGHGQARWTTEVFQGGKMSSTNAKINYKYAAIENTVIANLDPTRPHQSSDSSQGSPARCDDGLVFEPNTRSGMVLYPKAVCRTSLTPCFPRVKFFPGA